MCCATVCLAHAHDSVLCVSVESNGTAGFHDLHRHTFNPPPVLHFAGVHKKGTDGLPDSISRTFCPSPPAGLRFTDFELIQMGIFSAREKPCGVQLACPPDFSAAPTLSSGLQSLNQRHQRAVDLFTDALKTILQPLKGLPPLPLRFARFNERVKLVVSVVCPVMRRAALRGVADLLALAAGEAACPHEQHSSAATAHRTLKPRSDAPIAARRRGRPNGLRCVLALHRVAEPDGVPAHRYADAARRFAAA